MRSGRDAVRIFVFSVAGARLCVSRVRFLWQAQYLAMPGASVGEPVLGAVAAVAGRSPALCCAHVV